MTKSDATGEDGGAIPGVVDLTARLPPTIYSLHVTHYHGGRVEVAIEGVADDERSKATARRTFAQVCAGWLTPADIHALMQEIITLRAEELIAEHGPGFDTDTIDMDADPEFSALCAACAHYQHDLEESAARKQAKEAANDG